MIDCVPGVVMARIQTDGVSEALHCLFEALHGNIFMTTKCMTVHKVRRDLNSLEA
jgi:hypothetical protein